MAKDISEWAHTCLACQRSKISRHVHTKLEHIPISSARFQHVYIDLIGPLPTSEGYYHCLTMIDRFSRWPEAAPIKSTSTDEIVDAFMATWISRFGAPRTITTDRGTQFESAVFESFTRLLGCTRIRTTAYHPASNGIVECWHRSLKAAITCHGDQRWTKLLPIVLLGLRTAIKEDINSAAAELLYGENLTLLGEFFLNSNETPDITSFVQDLRQRMQAAHSQQTAHHQKKKVFLFKDLFSCSHVFVRIDSTKKPLQAPYDGPFKVLERSDKVFKILIKDRSVTISIERLKPAHMEKPTNMTDTTDQLPYTKEAGDIVQSTPVALKTYPGAKTKRTVSFAPLT